MEITTTASRRPALNIEVNIVASLSPTSMHTAAALGATTVSHPVCALGCSA